MRNMRMIASQLWSGRASASPHIATQNLENTNHDTPTIFSICGDFYTLYKKQSTLFMQLIQARAKKSVCAG